MRWYSVKLIERSSLLKRICHHTTLYLQRTIVGPDPIPIESMFWEENLQSLEFSLENLDADEVVKLVELCCEELGVIFVWTVRHTASISTQKQNKPTNAHS